MAKKIQKEEIINRQKLLNLLIFLIKFNLLSIPLYFIITYDLSLPQFQTFFATLTSLLLRAIGYNTLQKDFTLSILHAGKLNQIEISWDCTGWKSLYALFALVIATPAKPINKAKFLVFALPFLFLINLVRIISTIIFSLSYGFEYFDIIHNFLWKWSILLFIPLFWLMWAKSVIFSKK
jgi:exosortase/archaeosortase family protein